MFIKCAVSDVRLTVLTDVSELASGGVARVQRHAALCRINIPKG